MKKILTVSILLLILTILFPLSACKHETDYSDYVSENRSEVYASDQNDSYLRAYWSEREYPYTADGIISKKSIYFEVNVSLPDKTRTRNISFNIGGKTYGGEMSFDSVSQQYTYSEGIPCPNENEITFTVTDEENEETLTFTAQRVKTEKTLSVSSLLSSIAKDRMKNIKEYFGSEFNGEIYVRLIYEADKCYYYVGFIGKDGRCIAFLADGETAKILAEKAD